MKIKLVVFLVLFAALGGSAFGQGIRLDSTTVQEVSTTAVPGVTNVLTVPAAPQVAFCNFPANAVPCTNKATTFTSSTLGTPCSTSTQITLIGSTACVASPDVNGNFGFWAAAGTYAYTITLPGGINLGPYNVTLGFPAGTNLSLGTVTAKALNGSAIQFADQFAGSDASAKIQAAITALPATGGEVWAQALSDAGGTGSTIIDPGAKSVTLRLGPYTYQIQQLVLETNFHVIGAGDGQYSTSFNSLTVLQACATCAAINTVVLGTNGGSGGPIQHASMEGLRIYGATADTAIGMNLKTVNGANTGIWYSSFKDMCVGACGPSGASANGFSGGAITLDATGANTINQWVYFTDVQAWKTNGGSPAFSLLGTNGQIHVMECEFDGTTRNDGTTVVQIANSSGNQGPYSVTFTNATVQHGTTGINIAGAFSITFIGTHFENVGGAILVNSGVGGDISSGITFSGSTCQNFCGNNTGSGFFAKTTTPNAVSVSFSKNQIQSTVDASYTGFTNIQNFTSIGDESTTATTTVPLANLFGQQITYKTGSSAGDYTTTSTNYVGVDGTNLLASIFIPTGWKLVVSASGAIHSNTAAVQVFTAIADGGTPTVVNTSLVGAPANPTNFSLNTVISGNGATHSIDLRFKTSNAADAANIVNTAGNGIPQMVFTLMPSN